jgi:tetratricopeptide (TPR) repeat protein
MSYGISGRVDKAERLYAWGIAKEPKYPMFYYNLACTCAEEDKLDDAIKNLRLAWKYHSDVLPGDSFPDPRSDSSFAKYLNNEQFRAELDKMK